MSIRDPSRMKKYGVRIKMKSVADAIWLADVLGEDYGPNVSSTGKTVFVDHSVAELSVIKKAIMWGINNKRITRRVVITQ